MSLSDFGGFPPVTPDEIFRIRELEDLRFAVSECFRQRQRMRVRCFAHSMNGMSVPAPNETLLDLTGVRHVLWKGAGVITAGAGLSVWELDQHVRQFGWKLPVTNDGGAEAPSVGGFVAAGGIGEGSILHGGFWESVSALVIASGTGEVRRLEKEDPLFPWMFGTMGGLGVVYEADLELVPATSEPTGIVAASASLPKAAAPAWPEHLWLTLFVPENQRELGLTRLSGLVDAHPQAWAPRGLYEYYLARQRFNPPFLFDDSCDHIALGFWGDRNGEDPGLRHYFALEADFQQLVEDCGFRRYFQSELIWSRRELHRYVGPACAARYRQVKAELDPGELLNEFMPQRQDQEAASQLPAYGHRDD